MSEKPKPISAKVRAAIDAMVAGDARTITDAAAVAGVSREYLSRELSKPHITEHLRQKIRRSLAVGAARAGATKLALLDSPNEMVRDRASSFVLGLIGVVPEAASAAPPGTASLGVVIQIISHDPRPPVIDASPAQIEIIRP
ncbi:hypothetical protein [Bradyrhizobium japonicum]|uniref:hypothetical protein n=1 Tax=Bradyrhizobium japonicum TaxID=375 RepID=UPI001B8A5F59|nr:hypothetical protein [Bradyrhizobium japonicum]MBR0974095.1 hypothetical protein [Bradyrhizobium japonicum]